MLKVNKSKSAIGVIVALVSVVALLGTMFSVSVHAANNLNKKDDRSKRLIELANPSGVVITPASSFLTITFNTVANANSYTVHIYLGSTAERLVGSPRTGFNSGDSVTGLTPSTDYRVSVQAIGDQTRYSNSVDPRKFRTRTTAAVVQTGGDGLSEDTAGASAFQIKRDFPNSTDGLYWVKNSSINLGLPFQIYADMTGYGGGWTLIFANAAQGDNRTWTNQEVQSVNPLFAPANPKEMSTILGKYSILNFADYLKSKPSGFQYRIDASEFGRYGGIWTAHADYSFSDFNNNLKTNISEVAIWDYVYWDNGIEKRMPWASDGNGRLTTSEDSSGGAWWGTLASSDNGWQPAPWIQGSMEAPQSIWYWVR